MHPHTEQLLQLALQIFRVLHSFRVVEKILEILLQLDKFIVLIFDFRRHSCRRKANHQITCLTHFSLDTSSTSIPLLGSSTQPRFSFHKHTYYPSYLLYSLLPCVK